MSLQTSVMTGLFCTLMKLTFLAVMAMSLDAPFMWYSCLYILIRFARTSFNVDF